MAFSVPYPWSFHDVAMFRHVAEPCMNWMRVTAAWNSVKYSLRSVLMLYINIEMTQKQRKHRNPLIYKLVPLGPIKQKSEKCCKIIWLRCSLDLPFQWTLEGVYSQQISSWGYSSSEGLQWAAKSNDETTYRTHRQKSTSYTRTKELQSKIHTVNMKVTACCEHTVLPPLHLHLALPKRQGWSCVCGPTLLTCFILFYILKIRNWITVKLDVISVKYS